MDTLTAAANGEPTARPTAARRSRGRRTMQLFAVAALLATLTLGRPPAAAAWVYASTQYSPGGLSLPQVSAADLDYGFGPVLTFMTGSGPAVGRSPATTGAQDVYAAYALERWNGSAWGEVTRQRASVRIAAGQAAVRLPNLFLQPQNGKGYYRVSWGFRWQVAGSTSVLGTSIVVSDRISDHGCVTTMRPCQVSAGWIRVGRLYMLGGGW